jgi:lipid A 3-O-deacylase
MNKPLARLAALSLCLGFLPIHTQAQASEESPSGSGIWAGDIGEGFLRGSKHAAISIGLAPSAQFAGSREKHGLALARAEHGWVLTDVLAKDHWIRGNLGINAELFGGAQYDPDDDYVAGLSAVLRYSFATGGPVVPFLDAGAGLTLTDIRGPDLGGVFQFNLIAGAGAHWFVKPDTAVTLSYRLMHLSSAGLYRPNVGVNANLISLGVSWFF